MGRLVKRPRFPKVSAGQWVQPKPRGYLMACCDCGLVHRMNFRIVGVRKQRVQMQAFRHVGQTKAFRKRQGITVR